MKNKSALFSLAGLSKIRLLLLTAFMLLGTFIFLVSCNDSSDSSSNSNASPSPSFSGIDLAYSASPETITLHWEGATDDKTLSENILYNIYLGSADDSESLYNESNLLTAVTRQNEYVIDGLAPDTTYACLVVAEDDDGNISEGLTHKSVTTLLDPIVVSQVPRQLSKMNVETKLENENELTITGEDAPSLAADDILIVEEAGHMIKKIETVTTDDGVSHVKTTNATLADIISSGKLNSSITLTDDNTSLHISQKGITSAEIAGDISIWDDGETDSDDDNFNRSGELINYANGVDMDITFGIVPNLEYELTFTNACLGTIGGEDILCKYGLDYAQVKFACGLNIDATLKVNASNLINLSGGKEEVLYKRTKSFEYLAGPVPVYQTVTAELVARIEGVLQEGANFSHNYIASATISKGFIWDGLGINDADYGFQSTGTNLSHNILQLQNVEFDESDNGDTADVVVTIFPRIKTTFYKSASMDIALESEVKSKTYRNQFPRSIYTGNEGVLFSAYEARTFDVFEKMFLTLNADLSIFDLIEVAEYNLYKFPIIENTKTHALPTIKFKPAYREITVQAGEPVEFEIVVNRQGVNCNLMPEAASWWTDPKLASSGSLDENNCFCATFMEEGETTLIVEMPTSGLFRKHATRYLAMKVIVTPSVDDDGDGFSETQGDCDDSNPDITPDTLGYIDEDGDGYPENADGSNICGMVDSDNIPLESIKLEGELTSTTNDCDDTNPDIHPESKWYLDGDGDGYRRPEGYLEEFPPKVQCSRPSSKYKLFSELAGEAWDCDDSNPEINPETIWYMDYDGDGFSNGNSENECTRPSDQYISAEERQSIEIDCDDSDPEVHPKTIWYQDEDGDGYSTGKQLVQSDRPDGYCGRPDGYILEKERKGPEIDCMDMYATINPATIWYRDYDGDGYSNGKSTVSCQRPFEHFKKANELANEDTALSSDCDDSDPEVNPKMVWYKDADDDGYSTGTTKTQCEQPEGYKKESELKATSGDCYDEYATLNPETVWYKDEDGDKYSNGSKKIQCTRPNGYKRPSELKEKSGDCDDGNADLNPATVWYRDYDEDGYSNGTSTVGCQRPYAHFKRANELVAISGDCDDANADLNPATVWYKDEDNDGYSNGTTKAQCDRPDGYKLPSELIATSGDCYDIYPTINPETGWYKDIDDDNYSDGITRTQCERPVGYKKPSELIAMSGDCDDENASIQTSRTWYKDADNDNYSDGTTQNQCTRPAGYKLASELTATTGDCDDGNPALNPETVWYKDADNDGYSDGTTLNQCSQPAGYKPASELTDMSSDCNDSDPLVQLPATWYKDEDDDGYSDGTTLNECSRPEWYKMASELTDTSGDCYDYSAYINPETVWYKDADGDGYSEGTTVTQCEQPSTGNWIPDYQFILFGYDGYSNDCDDTNPQINPQTEWYRDFDGDHFRDLSSLVYQCESPGIDYHMLFEPGYFLGGSSWDDCDDTEADIYPDAVETSGDGIDSNCDGSDDT